MTVWEFFSNILKTFSPIVIGLVVLAAVVIVIAGFCKRGMGFFKYGFGGTMPESSLEKRLDIMAANMATKEDLTKMATATKEDLTKMDNRMATKEDLDGINTEVKTIKNNDFRHLKNFLLELTGILQDQGIINNENKARLDNHLRDM
jgi:hypothetical protein